MKRRRNLKPRDRWREGEPWGEYVRRLLGSKLINAALQRRNRDLLLWRWPAVVRVKSEYDRRRRARIRRNR
ncbi:hypothetical protein AB0I81_22725 [Nonomuraea sp. NPDC050404]|uniref:hypothetical protein n=1 Tax=Nonomuraea sp. NPDC050404 TaxID=3155783 RepID=UPI0033EFDDA1